MCDRQLRRGLLEPGKRRVHVRIQGIVQGVGFRPFIYQLALRHRLEGWVRNQADGVEAEIAELKQKIERLGNINLDAIKEQEELEERLAFLTAQRDDLETSRRQLDALIAELNAESKERFIEAFNAIRDNFREL
ncbi:MAG: hypothetical protein HGB17_07325, partial [Syntrophobacteraceae bacterium]|nr:hypothetical protein [Syntrophobacteraceae bacterium]